MGKLRWFLQHLQDGFIHLQDVVAEQHVLQEVDQGLDPDPELDHPGGEGGAGQIESDALQDVLLPIQWQGILILRDRDMRQEPGRGHGLRQQLGRERCGLDAQLAMGAGIFFPHVPNDPHLSRDDVELLGDLLSDLDEPLAIVSVDPLLGRDLVHHLDAREFCRQWLSARWRTPRR